jgi:hypothetical protein
MGGGVSDPLCLSTSSALHFFRLFFLGPAPCYLGWPASPCTCNGLWLLRHMAVSLKENTWFFVTDQFYALIQLGVSAQFWHQCKEWSTVWVSSKPLITEENWPGWGLNPGLPNDTLALYPLLHELKQFGNPDLAKSGVTGFKWLLNRHFFKTAKSLNNTQNVAGRGQCYDFTDI